MSPGNGPRGSAYAVGLDAATAGSRLCLVGGAGAVLDHPPQPRTRGAAACAEFARTLRPGGWLLVVLLPRRQPRTSPPGEANHLTEWFGERVDVDAFFLDPDDVDGRRSLCRGPHGDVDDGLTSAARRAVTPVGGATCWPSAPNGGTASGGPRRPRPARPRGPPAPLSFPVPGWPRLTICGSSRDMAAASVDGEHLAGRLTREADTSSLSALHGPGLTCPGPRPAGSCAAGACPRASPRTSARRRRGRTAAVRTPRWSPRRRAGPSRQVGGQCAQRQHVADDRREPASCATRPEAGRLVAAPGTGCAPDLDEQVEEDPAEAQVASRPGARGPAGGPSAGRGEASWNSRGCSRAQRRKARQAARAGRPGRRAATVSRAARG